MAIKIQAIRGMHDILPEHSPLWQMIEKVIRQVMASYAYKEIRLPIVEKTALFKRSIGEVTDIVEKEMYTFADRNGDSLTLRPEGTAGCLRACVEHSLLYNQIQRLWYYGPMFRYERPQKGRYRQFYQLGVETYGMPGVDIDVELICLAERMWRDLGISDKLELQINSLGTSAERLAYRAVLLAYFSTHQQALDADSQRRLLTNPLRILDSKNPNMQGLIEQAPVLLDSLGEQSLTHFQQFKTRLKTLGISYVINTRLVRGLDYYSLTVFEWVTGMLGAQGTVCAGGRYDSLVEQMSVHSNYAVGFAMGIERLLALVKTLPDFTVDQSIDVFMIQVGAASELAGMTLAEAIRAQLPELKIQVHCGGGNVKSQFKKADKSGAKIALILGETELANGQIGVKMLRIKQEQKNIAQNELVAYLKSSI